MSQDAIWYKLPPPPTIIPEPPAEPAKTMLALTIDGSPVAQVTRGVRLCVAPLANVPVAVNDW